MAPTRTTRPANTQDMDLELAQGWNPEVGDTLRGTVTSLSMGWSDYTQANYPIVTVQKDDGESVKVHCFHTALANELTSQRPVNGDRIAIKYHGQKDGRVKGTTVSQYVVKVEGRDQADFWDRAEGRRPQAPPTPKSPEDEPGF